MTSSTTYMPGLREEPVKLVSTQGSTLEDAAVRRSVPELDAEVTKLRKKLTEVRMERGKKSGGLLCAGVAAKYTVMKTLRLEYPVTVLCRVFDV